MVEVINANMGLVAALFISGAALGVIVARFTLPGPRRVAQLEEQLAKIEKEHEVYRAGVTAHFKTTAELVGEMTQSYKAVYDHLAHGAQSLCGEYDALTSSVFGASRIIHDPKVAIGETVVAEAESEGGAAAAEADSPTAEDSAKTGNTAPNEQESSPDSIAADASAATSVTDSETTEKTESETVFSMDGEPEAKETKTDGENAEAAQSEQPRAGTAAAAS